MVISDVISQPDNVNDNSDDDVIEVVRDEAPIEILSDGEEMELHKKSAAEKSPKTFTFAPVVQETYVDKVDNTLNNVPEDPLITPQKVDDNVVNAEPVQAVPVSIITHTSAIENCYKIDQPDPKVVTAIPETKAPEDMNKTSEKDIDNLNDDLNTFLNVDGEDPIDSQMNALFGMNIGTSPENKEENIIPN